jgi:hypothetical protein
MMEDNEAVIDKAHGLDEALPRGRAGRRAERAGRAGRAREPA